MVTRPPLMDMISNHETFSASALERVIKLHRDRGGLLAELLVQEGMMSEEDLFFLFSSELGVPVIPEERLLHLKLSSELRRKVGRKLAAERVLIPLDLDTEEGRLSVVMFDPGDEETLEALREACNVQEVRCYLARRSAILGALSVVYDGDPPPRKRSRTRPPSRAAHKSPAKRKAPAARAAPATKRPAPATKQPAPKKAARRVAPGIKPPPTPIPTEPKVELDPSLRQEIAAMESRPGRMIRVIDSADPLHGEPTALLSRPHHDSDEVTTPPLESRRLREVRGRSLFRQEVVGEPTRLFREVDQEPPTEELDLADLEEIDGDLEQTPQVREVVEDTPIEQLDSEDLRMIGDADLDAATPPLPALTEHESTPLVPLPEDDSGLTPLPDVMQMEELDALLRELLSSVGVLVSMLEERVDASGGICREYGMLARLTAREAGMDELTISRVSLAAYLFALDVTLRNEVGEPGPKDAVSAFSLSSGSPGGLGPSLRMLGARALGLSEDGGGGDAPVRLVNLVAQYLTLRAQSGDQGTDTGTVIQLLKAGGADAGLVDALARAMAGEDRTMVMRGPPGFMD